MNKDKLIAAISEAITTAYDVEAPKPKTPIEEKTELVKDFAVKQEQLIKVNEIEKGSAEEKISALTKQIEDLKVLNEVKKKTEDTIDKTKEVLNAKAEVIPPNPKEDIAQFKTYQELRANVDLRQKAYLDKKEKDQPFQQSPYQTFGIRNEK